VMTLQKSIRGREKVSIGKQRENGEIFRWGVFRSISKRAELRHGQKHVGEKGQKERRGIGATKLKGGLRHLEMSSKQERDIFLSVLERNGRRRQSRAVEGGRKGSRGSLLR